MTTFRVLGPLVAEDGRGEVDLRGPRHRAVLARLLVARGRVVPVDRLVDDLWDDPPGGAVGAVRTFVAALRRALEPDRPPRTPARLLVTSGPGYVLRASDVDAWGFEAAVADPAATPGRLADALAAWRGPAYADFADRPWARAEITRLDELRLLAVERRAAGLLAAGQAAGVVPDLEAHTGDHPWREEAWRLLALAQYRAGRQGDALATLRRARHTLADELGVDPGAGLRELEADILAQAPVLAPPQPVRATAEAVAEPLVGRAGELAVLTTAADETLARQRLHLALVTGDAGAGKTALGRACAAALADRGWTTAWGTNPDTDGLPAAWPWTEILAALPGTAPEQAPSGDPAAARFRWHRAVADHLAAHAPLLVVLDDLHLAGAETLALLAALTTHPVARPVLVLATYRATDAPPRLTDLLGRVAREEPTRVDLAGLPAPAIPALVRATTGREVDAATAATIHRRSGGNPFFVRELARLVAAGGDLAAVPAGVRDVVRYRLATLPAEAAAVLRHASVLGTDVDLDLLGAGALDAVEVAAERGFLVERAPGRFRFAHALVRDTLYADLSRSRRARLHAEVAAALTERHPDDTTALAHHLLLAGDTARAAGYARVAAERATDPHLAARLWRIVVDHGDEAARLDAVTGLARALAVTGGLADARRLRAEALDLLSAAEQPPDPVLTARVLTAFDVPAIWTEPDDPALAERVAALAEDALAALPAGERALRSRLLSTIALELRVRGGARAVTAAHDAEALARGLPDPAVLAFALNARFMQSFARAGGAGERVGIGTELVDLSAAHGLVTFEVLGHLILVQARAALADLVAADHHALAADRLGEEYGLPLVGVFTGWYRALRASILGEPAEDAYRAAADRLPGTGMSGLDKGILGMALLCDRLARGLPPEPADFGAHEPWCGPVLRPGAAVPPAPRDLLFEAHTCLHAVVALREGDRTTMARLYADLLPAAEELAGAGSGLLTAGPVARYLADLATALGDDRAAEEHRRTAARLRRPAPPPGRTG